MADQEFIPANKSQNHTTVDIQLAVAALMMEVVKADRRIDRLEVAQVIDTLGVNFKLDGDAVGQLLELAGDVGNYIVQLDSLTERIRDKWNHSERLELVKKLWGIAAADHEIDGSEVTVIEQVSILLGIDEGLSLQMRHQAEQDLIKEHS